MPNTHLSEELQNSPVRPTPAVLTEVPVKPVASLIELLREMRAHGGPALTTGLGDDVIRQFAERDPKLVTAIDRAHQIFTRLKQDEPELLAMDEKSQLQAVQSGYVNFYADDAINPFVALTGAGPWIVTLKGAVLHDSGGYGMLGLGHAPEPVLAVLKRRHVMANVMTPNLSQKRLVDKLRKELSHNRPECPFDRFLCLNSGSEAVTAAARISDIHAKLMTDPGGRYAGRPIKILSLEGGFHGRTDRPAQFSDSTRKTYQKYLATFRDRDRLITVRPNDIDQLREIFRQAQIDGIYIEAFFMEPVMGEGNPGKAITREFYDAARELTQDHGALLLIDSIQAGLRAHGVLSVLDYPGFETAVAPDMETYSKALNAGQYPLSVLAMTQKAASLYRKGVYGNTMTTNPRALDVACAVLDCMTPELRKNIAERGREFLVRLKELQEELGDRITQVQGTGLLFSVALDPERYKSYGTRSIEEFMRFHGVSVIHGGKNSLRFTPHFAITSEEVDLMVHAVREALLEGPTLIPETDEADETDAFDGPP
jgi:acetylornithine/succinyldiaminopimelate/putrescine aminotransferase